MSQEIETIVLQLSNNKTAEIRKHVTGGDVRAIKAATSACMEIEIIGKKEHIKVDASIDQALENVRVMRFVTRVGDTVGSPDEIQLAVNDLLEADYNIIVKKLEEMTKHISDEQTKKAEKKDASSPSKASTRN